MEARLRNLAGLIEFESAARWGSIRLAAEELHRTPSAVSQQIRKLEHTVGFPLFERRPRSVVLTERGQALAASLSSTLTQLGRQIETLRQEDPAHLLRITTTHSYAMKWLVPRLHRFTRLHPAIDIRVEANDAVADLTLGRWDVALRYAQEAAFPLAEPLLYREQLVVVYGPQLASGPVEPAALARWPLLYEGSPASWQALLARAGIRRRRLDFSRSFSHSGLLVQAAVAGEGAALVPYSLAYEDIAHGRLLRAAFEPVASDYGYRLIAAPGQGTSHKVRAFVAWMQAEVAAMSTPR